MTSHHCSDFDAELGARLRELRQKRKMTLAQLGRHLGLTAQAVQKFETGASIMAPSHIDKACTVLRTTPNVLFGHPDAASAADVEDAVMKDKQFRQADAVIEKAAAAFMHKIDKLSVRWEAVAGDYILERAFNSLSESIKLSNALADYRDSRWDER